MMKVVYIPLDERPCNTIYPIDAMKLAEGVEVSHPHVNILGNKKTPGNNKEIKNFLLEETKDADAIILSTEMLVYGGLVPSRLHHLDRERIHEYKSTIEQLRNRNKDVKIYVSNLIMRTPRYSSNDEEPEYYGEYGEQIFKYGWLKDQSNRGEIKEEGKIELEDLAKVIPDEVIEDYEKRRHFNVEVNKANVELLAENIIDFLVIPQDDAAEFGYTAMDQKEVFKKLKQERLKDVMIYPGADEVGFTLLARAYQEFHDLRLKIYPYYSSTYGPYIIPNYEDRPINETLKAHIMASGSELVYTKEEADIVLAYNTPGKKMQEAWDQFNKNEVTYSSYRHMPTFLNKIKGFLDDDIPVIIADSAYSNGGDSELIELLDSNNLYTRLLNYKAWNTNGNTVGSALSSGVLAYQSNKKEELLSNLFLHFYEDFIYQSIVRMDVTENDLPDLGLNYFDLKDKKEIVTKIVKDKMLKEAKKYLTQTDEIEKYDIEVDFPWNRMFEVSIHIRKNENKEVS